jgi:pentatricopeptide repeat protein
LVLRLSDEELEACRVPAVQPDNVETDAFAAGRDIDDYVKFAIDDALTDIKQKLEESRVSSEHFEGLIGSFLNSIGRENQQLTWPATLRGVADEFLAQQETLRRKSNQPWKVEDLRRNLAEALARGDRDLAASIARDLSEETGRTYREQRGSYETAAEAHAASLLSQAYLLMLARDYSSARGMYREVAGMPLVTENMLARARRSLSVSFTAVLGRSASYAAARAVLDEMKDAGVAPDVVTFSTLMNLAKDFTAARAVLDEMKDAGVAPNVVTCQTLVKHAPSFEVALQFEKELDRSWLVFSSGLYTAIFAKSVKHLDADELIAAYLACHRQFGEALGSPINQYRADQRPADAFAIALVAPHIPAAQKFWRERYAVCKGLFVKALEDGGDEDNLHYAYGIAAAINRDNGPALRHLAIARDRATHPKRIIHIDGLLGGLAKA